MLRVEAVYLFALSALAQPARADWPFEQASRHHREAAARSPSLGELLGQIGRRAPAHACAQPSAEFSGSAAPRLSAYSSPRMNEQAEKYRLMIALLARANGVPPSLVHRVI